MHSHALPISSRPGRASRWTFWRLAVLLSLSTWAAAGCASLPNNLNRPVTMSFNAPDETALGKLVLAKRSQAAARSESGFRLLDNEEAAFTSRLALIEGAQRTLDLQYYAIHADSSTEVLLERLRAAAARGVRVRILLDDFNTVGADAQVLRMAFEKNVELRLFNPLPGSRQSLVTRVFGSLHDAAQIQKRMHNKLFIADSALGITGGRNLGDAYFGRSGDSNFVDLDVLAAGKVVRDMAASFDHYWNDDLAYPVQTLLSKQDLENLRKPAAVPAPGSPDAAGGANASAAAAAARLPPATPTGSVLPDVTSTAGVQRRPMDLQAMTLTWAPALLLADKPGKIGPGDDEVDAGDTVVDGLLALMTQAKKEVLIVSPYFVPGAPMMKQFADLRTRGVRVRVLTNSLASNDAPAAHAGYARYRKQLLAMGIELYEMRSDQEGSIGGLGSTAGLGSRAGGSKSGASRASLHSKAVFIDGRLAVIGSMNLDLRSQLKNSEVALVIRSAKVVADATRLIEGTLAQGAYRLEQTPTGLVWRAPQGAKFKDATDEPEAGTKLKLLVNIIGPFAPDEML